MVRLEQRISLQLRLSPQHVLFSTLLQMPVMALEQRIKTELEQNPLLEDSMEEEIEQQEETEPTDPVQEELKNGDDKQEESQSDDSEEKEDFDIEDLINDENGYEYTPSYRNRDNEEYRPDPAPITLAEYLLSQFHFLQLPPEDSSIGEFIIWNINEDGYLSTNVETIANSLSTSEGIISPERIEKILKLIQTLEPVGIGARNLQECLLVQLRDKKHPNHTAINIIENHFDNFKKKRYEKLVKNLGVPIEEVKNAITVISKLNPKPGEGYINTNENYIVPDLIVEKVGNEFISSVNDSNVPQLRINNAYRRMLIEGNNISDETKKYIHQRLESARWLINSIQQRKITMIKVMKEIIKRQKDFFDKGQKYIKPMILKDIADAIGMDISTISRVTNGKYVQTDYGIFELKYFFSDKMKTDEGEEISTLRIKSQIKEIIKNENSKSPLTDGQIADMIAKKGIPLARRTVAKYREQLKIPVARLRRQI